MRLLVATTTLSLLLLSAPHAAAQSQFDTADVAPAAQDLEPAPDLGLMGDIILSDDEAFLDLAADAEMAWELVLDALLELEYDVEAQLYRHPDESWIRVDDLWLAVEPVPYLSGEWSRVRVRVGDFITDIDRGWSEVLLLQIAHRFDERLLETLVGEAALEDDARFTELGPIGDSWIDPGGVPYGLGSAAVPVSLDLTVQHEVDCYDGYGYGFSGFSYWGSPWFITSPFGGGPIGSWGWSWYDGMPFWDVAFGYGLPGLWLGNPYDWYHDPYHHHHHHDDHYDDGYYDDHDSWAYDDVGSFDEDDEGDIGTVVANDPVAPDRDDDGRGPRGGFVDVGGGRPGFIGRPETRRTTAVPIARRGPDTPSSVTRKTLYTPRGTRIITLEGPRQPSLPPITSTRTTDPRVVMPVAHGERGTPIFGTPRETPSAGIGMPIAPTTGGWTTVTTGRRPQVITRPSSTSSTRTSLPKTSSKPRVSTPKVSSKPRVSKPSASKSSSSRGKSGGKSGKRGGKRN